eukprot:753883-Hanusia_phi.AAC.1
MVTGGGTVGVGQHWRGSIADLWVSVDYHDELSTLEEQFTRDMRWKEEEEEEERRRRAGRIAGHHISILEPTPFKIYTMIDE